jgi:IS5 family transposase
MRRFAGVRTDADIIPDETSILNFLRLLESDQLTERLLTEINAHLSERGPLVGKGTTVYASIIDAPSSTENAKTNRFRRLVPFITSPQVTTRFTVPEDWLVQQGVLHP